MSEIASRGYSFPDSLVSTDWVANHLNDPNIRLVESNEDPLLYSSGHIPGAAEVDWTRDLNDPVRRDYLQRDGFQALAQRLGLTSETTVVFYGDKNNWWATYALWVFQLFGHSKVKVMDGGRLKWGNEGRELTRDKPSFAASEYQAEDRNDTQFRAYRDQVLAHLDKQGKMIDVRSPEEYDGTRLHMEAYPNEGALRGGHIPGAANVPWAKAVNPETGEFKTAEQLRGLYEEAAGLNSNDNVIVYCRIGERSSHTWFALRYLLGYQQVRNYDGSWTEWGNLVGVPIER
jgi:thiosulfate/3-mercaptopyruvate sulfurtransferase